MTSSSHIYMKNIHVVLIEPNHSGNIGAIARAMANFGFEKLIIVSPRCQIDDEARNRAKHAQKILSRAKIVNDFYSAVKRMNVIIGTTGIIGNDYNLIRSPILAADISKRILETNGEIALVFGREDIGLYNEELKKCDFTVTIPTDKKYPVMNLSHAVSVLLYEIYSKKNSDLIKDKHKQMNPREKHELLKVVNSLIEQTRFRTEDEKTTQKLIWKKYVGKAMLTKREAYGLIGFLKKLKR